MAVTAFAQHQGFSPLELGFGWAIDWEGTQPGQLTNWPKGYSIPYDVMFISKIMRGGGGRKGFLWLWHWSYRATITHAGNLIFQDIPAHPPASGECFAPAYIFWFPYYAVIILNRNFLAFLLFLPHLMKKSVSKRLGRGLGAGRSQLTTPSFKSIVPGLFAYFDCLNIRFASYSE